MPEPKFVPQNSGRRTSKAACVPPSWIIATGVFSLQRAAGFCIQPGRGSLPKLASSERVDILPIRHGKWSGEVPSEQYRVLASQQCMEEEQLIVEDVGDGGRHDFLPLRLITPRELSPWPGPCAYTIRYTPPPMSALAGHTPEARLESRPNPATSRSVSSWRP
jgi:hypothetical protein